MKKLSYYFLLGLLGLADLKLPSFIGISEKSLSICVTAGFVLKGILSKTISEILGDTAVLLVLFFVSFLINISFLMVYDFLGKDYFQLEYLRQKIGLGKKITKEEKRERGIIFRIVASIANKNEDLLRLVFCNTDPLFMVIYDRKSDYKHGTMNKEVIVPFGISLIQAALFWAMIGSLIAKIF